MLKTVIPQLVPPTPVLKGLGQLAGYYLPLRYVISSCSPQPQKVTTTEKQTNESEEAQNVHCLSLFITSASRGKGAAWQLLQT